MIKLKNSEVDWIGEIPEHWEVDRIKKVLEERVEKNDPIKTDNILSLTNDRGVIPYSEKGLIGNNSKEDISGYKLAYPNDIVLNSMNVVIGSVGISQYFGAVSPVYYMLKIRNEEDSIKYYNYLFQTQELQKYLKGFGNGILEIRMRIPMVNLNSVKIPIPSSKEQHKIAEYLDKKCSQIDKLIQLQKGEIENFIKYKESVIENAVTKGINKNVSYKETNIDWIGEIPEHWKVCRVKNFGRTQNGISKGGEYFGAGFPFVSYGDVYKNYQLPKEVDGLAKSSEEDRDNYSVKAGDIFFTRTSETIEEVGFSSVCKSTINDAVFSGFLIRLRPYNQTLCTEFAKYYFRSKHLRNYLTKEMNIVTRASLSQDLLNAMTILVPPKNEQMEIALFLEDIDEKIAKLIKIKEEKIKNLQDYKKSLIYECVTGKKEI